MKISNRKKALLALASAAALVMAIGAPGTLSASSSQGGGVVIVSDVTNIESRSEGVITLAAGKPGYTLLRDNFRSKETCESYRTQYVVRFAYHRESYCSERESNDRHWLWVRYDYSCVDRVVRQTV